MLDFFSTSARKGLNFKSLAFKKYAVSLFYDHFSCYERCRILSAAKELKGVVVESIALTSSEPSVAHFDVDSVRHLEFRLPYP